MCYNRFVIIAAAVSLHVAAAAYAQPSENGSSEPVVAPSAKQKAEAASSAVRLRSLEQRVNELKENVFRSKARLNLLKETVLHGVIAGSRAIIKHKNDMGGSFKLVKLVYGLDGAQIYAKADESGELDEKREFNVFNGSIVPGDHTISVQMIFNGDGFGLFSYLKGYQFNVKSSYTFTAAEGKQIILTVRGYEKGDFTTELEERPSIRFEADVFKVGAQAGDSSENSASGSVSPEKGMPPSGANP